MCGSAPVVHLFGAASAAEEGNMENRARAKRARDAENAYQLLRLENHYKDRLEEVSLEDFERKGRLRAGALRNALGAGGFDVNVGTPLAVQKDFAAETGQETLLKRHEAALDLWRRANALEDARADANFEAQQAKSAKRKSKFDVARSFLG